MLLRAQQIAAVRDIEGGLDCSGTHVAADTKTSMVFALVKHDIAVVRTAEASTMTANRSAMLASVLRTTIGTRRRTTITKAVKDRASLCTTESDNIDTLGSREILDRDCDVD